jgi:hypothetical protein
MGGRGRPDLPVQQPTTFKLVAFDNAAIQW